MKNKLIDLKVGQKFTYVGFIAVLHVTHKTPKTVTIEDVIGTERTVRGKEILHLVNLPEDSGYRR